VNGANLLTKRVRTIRIDDYLGSSNMILDTNADIKTLTIENFPAGLAALSVIYSQMNSTILDNSVLYPLSSRLVYSGISAYEAYKNILKSEKAELGITFNGRMLLARAFISACEKLSINYQTVEFGCTMDHYILIENTIIHDIRYRTNSILRQWESSEHSQDEKVRISEEYFALRRYGNSQRFKNFTLNQERNKLPENWNQDKRNFVIFISSLDEIAAIRQEWDEGVFSSQLEGIEFINGVFQNNLDLHFYVRLHPNLLSKNKNLVEHIVEFFKKNIRNNFTLLLPDSKVSSYTLIERCEKIISFGSTTGIEATFYNKPSITLAPFYYQFLDVSYFPKLPQEVINMIEGTLEPKPMEGVFKYAYYLMTHGEKFSYYSKENDIVYFNNKNVILNRILKLEFLYFLARLFNKNMMRLQ
jgi:hypothetical protein